MNNNEKINISKSDYIFILSINPNVSDKSKSKIDKQVSKIKIDNLIVLDDDSQYNYTYDEIKTLRSLSDNAFCKNIHSDDIDEMFDKYGKMLVEVRLDDNTLIGFSLIEFITKEKYLYVHLLCASSKYKKVGTIFIDIFKEMCKQLDFDEIRLDSVTDAVGFYIKLNFKCYNDNCLLEKIRKNKEKLVVVNTDQVIEYIDKRYECLNNKCLLVYKIKNMSGGRKKTLKKKRIFLE